MGAIDPVTLVVVQNGLQQVASEMDLTFERAAFLPVISEGFDRFDGKAGVVRSGMGRHADLPARDSGRRRHADGPAIVEQFDATPVIEPGGRARVDALGNLEITVRGL